MTEDGNIESILSAMDKVMRAVSEHREKVVCETLRETCPMKGCECVVRTAKWVIEADGRTPMVERLVLMCDAGHEWYKKFAMEFDDRKVLLRVQHYAVPFEQSMFREMEAAVEGSVHAAQPQRDSNLKGS